MVEEKRSRHEGGQEQFLSSEDELVVYQPRRGVAARLFAGIVLLICIVIPVILITILIFSDSAEISSPAVAPASSATTSEVSGEDTEVSTK